MALLQSVNVLNPNGCTDEQSLVTSLQSWNTLYQAKQVGRLTLLVALSLNNACTSRSATSSLCIAPHTLTSSVRTPRPVAGCVFRPPGRMTVNCISPPMLCTDNKALTAIAEHLGNG